MNSNKGIVRIEKEVFEERSKNLSKTDIEWILEKVVSLDPQLAGYKNDPDKEWRVYDRASSLLYGIDKNKPSDIRAYVENELKKQECKNKLEHYLNRADGIPSFDIAAGDALKSDLEKYEQKIKGESLELYKEVYSRFRRVYFVINLRKEGKTERDVHIRGWSYPEEKSGEKKKRP